MTSPNPTPDELLAMAYVDGELHGEQRASFEARLASDPRLLREVAEHNSLAVLARQVTPKEPMDHEWERMEQETLHGAVLPMSLVLSAAGAIGLILCGMLGILFSDLPIMLRLFFLLLMGGLASAFLLVLRARIRTHHLDPYTSVKR